MKLFLNLIFLLSLSAGLTAQDIFKEELFSADLVMKHRADLDLSDAQATKIKTAYSAQIGEFNSLKWDLDAALNDLNKALANTKVDKAGAIAKMEKVTGLEDRLKRVRLGMMIDIKNVLTADQQKTLKSLRTEVDMNTPTFHIAAINENPRMVLKVNGDQAGGPQPLFIIVNKAGESSRVNSMESISPDEIEAINVLKGKSAISKYGEDGKNGVVIITTKN
jgi:TonB-dependent SusC/RagA subfamily outer membrane receptor